MLAPEVFAVAQEPGALAVHNHLGEDVHVGGELARLGLVAAMLVEAELDRVEVSDPNIDDELGPAGLPAEPTRLARGGWRGSASHLQRLSLGLARGFLCRIGLQHRRTRFTCHRCDSLVLPSADS